MHEVCVLLVEDEAPKRGHVEGYLAGFGTAIRLEIAESVNGALDAIEHHEPDVLLLDMSLPTFSVGEREGGGRPQGFGGLEVLRHMTMAGYAIPTIVITGYEAIPREGSKPVTQEQMRAEIKAEFPTIFRDLVHYNSTYDEWKAKLGVLLTELGIEGVP